MAKEKPVKISVSTIFDGKKSEQQAFIELILYKRIASEKNKNIDGHTIKNYNYDKVFSDVRVV